MTGSGTLADPYVIYDVNDLQNMNLDLAAYYELANDIDASATVGWNAGAGFIPIGQAFPYFTGHFDGKGYKITELFINDATVDGGLFGGIGVGAEVKNVGLESCDITSRHAAALATNINAALPVAANGNISIGLAWDDWHPFVGGRIIVGVAPTTGRLKVEYSIQE